MENREVVPWLCSYTPVELLHAAGASPVRLIPERPGGARADALLPRSFCPYVRAVLDTQLPVLATAVSCDCMRRLLDAVPQRVASWVPRVTSAEPVERQVAELAQEFKRFWFRLHTILGKPLPSERESVQALANSMQLYRTLRGHLQKLHAAATAGHLRFSEAFRYAVTAMSMPPEEALNRLNTLPTVSSSASTGPAVLVTGSNLLDASVVALVEEVGARVVDVDSCIWSRWANTGATAPESCSEGPKSLDELLRALAAEYLHRPPCPRQVTAALRAQLILEQALHKGAAGVIHLVPKFCDVGLYEAPVLRKGLEAQGIPCLLLQVDYGWGTTGQARTRIEAFVEMLTGVSAGKDGERACSLQS